MPLVSVLLTVARRTDYLDAAIRSVLNQTCPDFELIVTDDANSPAARAICARFAADPRLRYRANSSPLGMPLNLAAALRDARAPLLTILNDDDLLAPSMLGSLLGPLQRHPEVDVAFGARWLIDARGCVLDAPTRATARLWRRAGLQPGLVADPFRLALRGVVFLVMGALVRNTAFDPAWLVPNVEGAYDHWLTLRLARAGRPFFFLDRQLFYYRLHPGSESARVAPEKAACQVYVLSSLLRENLSLGERVAVEDSLAAYLFTLGRDRLYFGNPPAARAAFAASARLRPRLKTVAGLFLTLLPGRPRRRLFRAWRTLRGIATPLPGRADAAVS